jgi:hypothetical protein
VNLLFGNLDLTGNELLGGRPSGSIERRGHDLTCHDKCQEHRCDAEDAA